jgi:hypothetical protein
LGQITASIRLGLLKLGKLLAKGTQLLFEGLVVLTTLTLQSCYISP